MTRVITAKPKRRGKGSTKRHTLASILRTLRAHLPDLSARYNIKSLGVFGSYVRKDATAKSDLDLLIEFGPNDHLSLMGYVGLENELSDLVGVKVDLIERAMLKPPILENVMREVVGV